MKEDNKNQIGTQTSGKKKSSAKLRALVSIVEKLSITEKVIFFSLCLVFAISGLSLVAEVHEYFLIEVPTRGGTITEGVIGTPHFVNPVLAVSDADRDISSLIYSGLLRATPSGSFIPDLAESYTVSEDGLTYTFIIKDDAVFHNGVSVTADDVEFTIQKFQDESSKSPRRGNWDGVTVKKISNREIQFVLKQPYALFLENATAGIIPKHIWKDTDEFFFSTYNTEPIGSGPYKIKSVKKTASGAPISYTLAPFEHYTLGEPYVSKIVIKLYPNLEALVDALTAGDIDSAGGISPEYAVGLEKDGFRIEQATLPRTFAVFFNQNQSKVFIHKEIRKALDLATDKEGIVNDVLRGFGKRLVGPLSSTRIESTRVIGGDVETRRTEAKELLAKSGWKINAESGLLEKEVKKEKFALKFSIATSDAPELLAAANILKENWRAIGADVEIKVFEAGDLKQNIIRPRKYDALLFGVEIVGREPDFYPFWHSSQRTDPGLNIALYTNIKVDKLLEDIRSGKDKDKRHEQYTAFEDAIVDEAPAIFLYSPDFIYVLPKDVRNVRLSNVTNREERFLDVHNWYIDTDKVWSVFAQVIKH